MSVCFCVCCEALLQGFTVGRAILCLPDSSGGPLLDGEYQAGQVYLGYWGGVSRAIHNLEFRAGSHKHLPVDLRVGQESWESVACPPPSSQQNSTSAGLSGLGYVGSQDSANTDFSCQQGRWSRVLQVRLKVWIPTSLHLVLMENVNLHIHCLRPWNLRLK